jgi:hypothetical protein
VWLGLLAYCFKVIFHFSHRLWHKIGRFVLLLVPLLRLLSSPDLCRNTMKYRNTHKRRDAAEIRLHFINNKRLKNAYRQNGNKLARALVAYL